MEVVLKAEALMASAAVAAADEKRLRLELSLVDVYGVPRWTVEGQFADGWRKIASGVWKPKDGEGAAFTAYATFTAKDLPGALRLAYCGYGTACLRHVSVEDRSERVVPRDVLAVSGRVLNPHAVLVDDYEAACFGRSGYLAQFRDPQEAEAQSVLTVSLMPEP